MARSSDQGDPEAGTDDTLAAGSPATDETVEQARDAGSDATAPAAARSAPPDWQFAPTSHAPAPTERYKTHEELGRGGLGQVLLATDRWLGRSVALKRLHAHHRGAVERFRREAVITARLQHPAIIPIYDADHWGTAESPFYAMKVVEGRSLDALVRDARTLESRLALLANVRTAADAVAFAHSRGVVHRDLKPANVMIGDFGETVVIDWGLAKDLRASDDDEPMPEPLFPSPSGEHFTVAGAVMGTPAYMAPEQARGEPAGERADVYALGAILYHLLAGAPPYRAADSGGALALVLAGPPAPLRELVPDVPGELETIVERAMARDPDARYPSASELAADIKRFETGQLVTAHSYSPMALARRWIVAHRAAVTAAALGLVATAAIGGVALHRVLQARERAEAQAQIAQTQRARAEAVSLDARRRADEVLLLQARGALDRDPTEALAWLGQLEVTEHTLAPARAIAQHAVTAGVASDVLLAGVRVGAVAFSPDGRWLASSWSDGAILLRDVAAASSTLLPGSGGQVWALAFSPDGSALATIEERGTVAVWDLASRREHVLGRHAGTPASIEFSPDGSLLVTCVDGQAARLWRLASGATTELGHPGATVSAAAFVADGRVVTGATDGTVRAWDRDGAASRTLGRHRSGVTALRPAPGGGSVVTGAGDGDVRLWSLVDGTSRLLHAHDSQFVNGVAYSPDGRWVASTGEDHLVRIADLHDGGSRAWVGHASPTWHVAFSAGGDRLVSSSTDGVLRVWNVADGDGHALLGHARYPQAVAMSATGAIASSDNRGQLRIWQLPVVRSVQLGRAGVLPPSLAASRDGAVIAYPMAGGDIRVVDAAGRELRVLRGHGAEVYDLCMTPDGSTVVSVGLDGAAQAWDLRSATSRHLPLPAGKAVRVVCAASGDYAGLGGVLDVVTLIPLTDTGGETASVLGGPDLGFTGGDFSPDGLRFATASTDGRIHVVDLRTGERSSRAGGHEGGTSLRFTPSGDGLVGCTRRHELWMWGASGDGGRLLAPGCRPEATPTFSPSGALVAYVGDDYAVRVLDVAAGTARSFEGHRDVVWELAFTDDERYVASASSDRTVRLWDLRTGTANLLPGHDGPVVAMFLAPDASFLVSAGVDGQVRRWGEPLRDPVPPSLGEFRRWLAATTRATVGPARALANP